MNINKTPYSWKVEIPGRKDYCAYRWKWDPEGLFRLQWITSFGKVRDNTYQKVGDMWLSYDSFQGELPMYKPGTLEAKALELLSQKL